MRGAGVAAGFSRGAYARGGVAAGFSRGANARGLGTGAGIGANAGVERRPGGGSGAATSDGRTSCMNAGSSTFHHTPAFPPETVDCCEMAKRTIPSLVIEEARAGVTLGTS